MSRSVLYIILYSFFHEASLFAARPYISLLSAGNGADNVTVGIISSIYSIGQVIFAIWTGRLIDKFGPRRPIIISSFVFICAALGLVFANNLYVIAIASFVMGVSHIVSLVAEQSAITAGSETAEHRDSNISTFMLLNSIGMFIGPTIGGYAQEFWGLNNGFWPSVIFGIFAFAVALPIKESIGEEKAIQENATKRILTNSAIMKTLTVNCVVLFTWEVTVTYFPLYAKSVGLAAGAIGLFLSVKGFAAVIVRIFMSALIRILGKPNLLKICLVLCGIGIALHTLSFNYIVLLGVGCLAGAAYGLLNPLSFMLVSSVSPHELRNQVFAIRLMGNFIGQTISPIIFGFLSKNLGLSPVFWISGACLMICPALLSEKKEKKTSDEASL